ncbi:hypothetical protein Nmel_010100 [Mimus melanotis]
MAARALCSTLMSTARSRNSRFLGFIFYFFPGKFPREPAGGRAGCSRCSSGSSLRRLGGTVVIRIFTVASAELISKPVSLVSMVSTEGKHREFHQECHVEGLGATTGTERGLTFTGVLRPQALHNLVPQGCHGFHWEKEVENKGWSRGLAPRAAPSPARGHSQVGRIFRITTRSATLCPVVMVPFL